MDYVISRISTPIQKVAGLSGGLAIFIFSTIALCMVSLFTFRIAEGFAFAVSTLAACGLVYFLSAVNEKWS